MDRIQNTVTNFEFRPTSIRNVLHNLELPSRLTNAFTEAAVLLPVFNIENNPHILLTKRSDKTTYHKGEIALPGGTKEPSDSTSLETALRETQEELGIQPSTVEILGQLNTVTTKTGFLINSFVGEIRGRCPLTINYHEVADTIELPISLLAHWADTSESLESNQPGFHYGPHYIWGATFRILKEFSLIIKQSCKMEMTNSW